MKTCPKCNALLPDDAAFCNECGASLGNAGSTAPGNGSVPSQSSIPTSNPFPASPIMDGDGTAAAPKKNNTALIGIIAVAAVALIAIFIVIFSALGAYKKPITTLVGLANKRSTNIPAYIDCVAPSFVSSSYKSLLGTLKGGDAKKELDETINDGFDDLWDELEDEYGKNWKITIEWKDADKLSDKKLKNIQEAWEDLADTLSNLELDDEDTWESIADKLDDEYDTELNTDQVVKIMGKLVDQIEDAKITAAYEVDVKLTISGKDNKDSEKMTVTVIKVNGKWIIDPTSGAGGYDISDLTYMLRYM